MLSLNRVEMMPMLSIVVVAVMMVLVILDDFIPQNHSPGARFINDTVGIISQRPHHIGLRSK
ncbi:unnamed protein product [Heligmosomoides polygyrus]|uniref:Neur_chan_memb domain-containing protein n=1 Tax=Heligmosomoides polygyrus TaxID=6339 RepID=A0A183FBT7_HELPZ|nr:unnamed protein product [Heligmosomoides polygyrus]